MGTRDKPIIGIKGPDVSSKNTSYTCKPDKKRSIYFLFVMIAILTIVVFFQNIEFKASQLSPLMSHCVSSKGLPSAHPVNATSSDMGSGAMSGTAIDFSNFSKIRLWGEGGIL